MYASIYAHAHTHTHTYCLLHVQKRLHKIRKQIATFP